MDFYLLDSNVIIDFLNNKFGKEGNQFLQELLNSNRAVISVITRIEVLGYSKLSDDEINKLEALIKRTVVCPLETDIVQYAIAFKQRGEKSIKTPDAIIAATAKFLEISLITNNTRDFDIPYLGITLTNLHMLR